MTLKDFCKVYESEKFLLINESYATAKNNFEITMHTDLNDDHILKEFYHCEIKSIKIYKDCLHVVI